MMSRARRLAVLVLVAVFLTGLAGGWFLEEAVDDVRWPWAHQQRNGGDRDGDDARDDDVEEDFLEGLGLTREQHEAVDRLLDEREDRLEGYWKGRLPAIEALIDSTRSEIRNHLTPGQRAAYDRWVEEQRGRSFNQ